MADRAQPSPRDPTVSVVVPMFNAAGYIRQTLQCVLAQTCGTLEVVVVDDGSTDDGPRIVRELCADPRVALVTKPHLGIAGTRNTGIAWAAAGSDYLLFLDQDDLIAADLIAGLVEVLEGRPDAVGAYAIADYIDSAGQPLADGYFARHMRTRRTVTGGELVPLDPHRDVCWPELFPANHVYPPSAVLLRRRDVLAIGGFDAGYEVADDWDLILRLLRRGPIVPWDRIRVGYRRHEGNASGDRARNVRETRAVWANTFHDRGRTRAERAVLRTWWRALQRDAARRKTREAAALLRRGAVARALARMTDAAAHRALARPPRRWRTERRLLPADLAAARIGSRERRGDPQRSTP